MRIGLFDLMNCQVNLYRFFLIVIIGIMVVKFSDGVFVTEYLLNKDLKKALLIIKGQIFRNIVRVGVRYIHTYIEQIEGYQSRKNFSE